MSSILDISFRKLNLSTLDLNSSPAHMETARRPPNDFECDKMTWDEKQAYVRRQNEKKRKADKARQDSMTLDNESRYYKFTPPPSPPTLAEDEKAVVEDKKPQEQYKDDDVDTDGKENQPPTNQAQNEESGHHSDDEEGEETS